MLKAKICGITDSKDALLAASLGAWAVGFIFYKKSKRFVGPYKAKKIISELPPFVTPVGVFVDQKEGAVKDIAEFCGLRALQFHGDETPSFCKRFDTYKVIKAFRVKDSFDVEVVRPYKSVVSAFLFDRHEEGVPGGTGKTFDWKLIKESKNFNVPIIISGGIHSNNVRLVFEEIKPYAVDVSSGVEDAPGKKSERSLTEFLNQLILPVSV
jgi:phosphoribosylanthranilate isomerase